jgi:hypothetical protein
MKKRQIIVNYDFLKRVALHLKFTTETTQIIHEMLIATGRADDAYIKAKPHETIIGAQNCVCELEELLDEPHTAKRREN